MKALLNQYNSLPLQDAASSAPPLFPSRKLKSTVHLINKILKDINTKTSLHSLLLHTHKKKIQCNELSVSVPSSRLCAGMNPSIFISNRGNVASLVIRRVRDNLPSSVWQQDIVPTRHRIAVAVLFMAVIIAIILVLDAVSEFIWHLFREKNQNYTT